ncbi:type II toxin-antitoxin system RelE/ParE family toxin [Burkholderia cenocepacia]|nr:type II toxin-antitoxin system RelE/ParE family toxin [Burkholderia cenocepacia]MCW5186954.1 type II toxin-antitoxin system RelE/ParE family toxin [Burkholderia cenocepacia]
MKITKSAINTTEIVGKDYELGVYELVEDHRGDKFRAVYAVRISNVVLVLHAFKKKSKFGITVPQPEVELTEKRLEGVLARPRASWKA